MKTLNNKLKLFSITLLILLLISILSCSSKKSDDVSSKQNQDKTSSNQNHKDQTEKNERSYTCDAIELLENSGNLVISDEYATLNIKNKTVKYTYFGYTKDITELEYTTYKGSFINENSDECMVCIIAKGDFSMAEGGGLSCILIFDKDGKLLKNCGLFPGNAYIIETINDVDNNGISEIFYIEWGHGAGMLSKGLTIAYGDIENSIFYRTTYLSSDYSYAYCETKYEITGNKVIFNTDVEISNNGESSQEESFKDVFEINNGKVKHIEGNMENLEEYLNKFQKTNY